MPKETSRQHGIKEETQDTPLENSSLHKTKGYTKRTRSARGQHKVKKKCRRQPETRSKFAMMISLAGLKRYSPRQPVGRKMARHQIKQIDLKSWEYKGIHHSKSAYWGRFLKTLLKFRDPLTGGLPWRMFSVDLFSNGSPVFPVSPSKSNSFPRNPAKSQRIHTTFDFPMVQWFPGFPFEI